MLTEFGHPAQCGQPVFAMNQAAKGAPSEHPHRRLIASVAAGRWRIDYMRHLKTNYPYLFMVAAHRNPFREPLRPAAEA